jgi:hypothetical protein
MAKNGGLPEMDDRLFQVNVFRADEKGNRHWINKALRVYSRDDSVYVCCVDHFTDADGLSDGLPQKNVEHKNIRFSIPEQDCYLRIPEGGLGWTRQIQANPSVVHEGIQIPRKQGIEVVIQGICVTIL